MTRTSAPNKTDFGFCLPIFANPGVPYFRTPNYEHLGWKELKESIQLTESLGYDSVFVADHLLLGNEGAIWECWTILSAIAGFTERLKLAPIHLCDSFRNPALMAKMIATLDHVSNGRYIHFYDFGWRKKEFDQYGYYFDDVEERIKRMDEGLTMIKGMLRGSPFSFSGKYYSVHEVICRPTPIAGKVPIWMGEANHPTMVSSIVKHADTFNSMPVSLQGFKDKLEILYAECDRQGRDRNSINLSLETQVLIVDSEAEIQKIFEAYRKLKSKNKTEDQDILEQLFAVNPGLENYNNIDHLREEFMIGTVAQLKDTIQAFVDLGVDHFMLWFMDYPGHQSLNRFAKEVMPEFSGK